MKNLYVHTLEEKKKMMREQYMRSLLTKREAAHELGNISTSTIDRMRQDGTLKSCRVRGQIMFSIDELCRFLMEV